VQQQFINLRRGRPGPLEPPVDTLEGRWSDVERIGVQHALTHSFVGTRETVRRGLHLFIESTAADELIVVGHIFDHAARVRSFEIAAEAHRLLASGTSSA
jgi:alkanesulfonate monooxygenase SsuD/methylene tetrahydromethanopterin reductase-like flavin-dependent oxidoreductase (luciferase family)